MKKIMLGFLLLTPLFSFGQNKDTLTELITLEEWAQYPGGYKEMRAFIQKNLNYPQEGTCFEGKVYIKIDVDSCGNISNFVIRKGIIEEANKEALRVVGLMPKVWTPAKVAGRPINSSIVIPIIFGK